MSDSTFGKQQFRLKEVSVLTDDDYVPITSLEFRNKLSEAEAKTGVSPKFEHILGAEVDLHLRYLDEELYSDLYQHHVSWPFTRAIVGRVQERGDVRAVVMSHEWVKRLPTLRQRLIEIGVDLLGTDFLPDPDWYYLIRHP